jgi:hypothetical protein
MSDDASFDPTDLQAIWGWQPGCALTNRHERVEFHHILGRGGKHHRNRQSSIYNAIPLEHDFHASAYRDHRCMVALFLEIVRKSVQQKIVIGEYFNNKNDRDFLAFSEEFLL